MYLSQQIAETTAHSANAVVLDTVQRNLVLAQLAAQRSLPTQEQFELTPESLEAGLIETGSHANRPTLAERLRKSISRARDALMLRQPPGYCRGAWSIINDIPYPPPPPYAGNSRPPSYDDAMEIGVVASPMRVAEQRSHGGVRRTTSTPGLSSLAQGEQGLLIDSAGENDFLPAGPLPGEELLPEYPGTGEHVYSSEVVSQWQLGERAIEKPPIHPRGYRYPAARRVSESGVPQSSVPARTTDHLGSRSLGWTLFSSSYHRPPTSS